MTARVLLVGSGFVTPMHAAGWAALHPRASIVAIASPDMIAAEDRARDFAIPRVFADVESALREMRPDIVDICSPLEWHSSHIRLAAEARANVICQKPLAPSLDEAITIAQVARDAGIRLMVHENFRFRPWIRQAHAMIQSGDIGPPIFARSSFRIAGTVTSAAHPEVPWSVERQPFFARMDQLLILESVIHQIDVLRYLLGEPASITARARRISDFVRGEDLVTLLLDFDACHAVIERSYASRGQEPPPALSEDLLIEGTEGLISIDRRGTLTLQVDQPSRRTTKVVRAPPGAYRASYGATISHFLDALESNSAFETGPLDNLRTLDATFAAYAAAHSQLPVSLPTQALASALPFIEQEPS